MPVLLAQDLVRDTKPIYASPSTTVEEAARIMAEHNIGCIPVVSDGRVVGIFTERDLVRLVAEHKPLDTKLEEVMTKHLVTAHPRDTLPVIAEKMLQHNIRHIPVVDEQGRLLGIISIKRVLRHLLSREEHP